MMKNPLLKVRILPVKALLGQHRQEQGLLNGVTYHAEGRVACFVI